MNKCKIIMHAERIRATLKSINNGDSVATDECALFVSENTLDNLVKSADVVVEHLLDSMESVDVDEDEREYIEVPLDSYEYIENLTTKQVGAVFKNVCVYFFGGAEFEDMDSEIVKDATGKTIARIKEYAKNGE